MWEVVGQGVICIAIAVACAAFAVRGVVPGLMAVLVVVATYGAVLLMNLAIKHFGTSAKIKTEEEG